MPNRTPQDLLEELYSKISNFILPTDMTKSAPAPTGFVTMMLPGITVFPSDFDSKTPTGRRNLNMLCDRLPAFNRQYMDSTKTVSGMYPFILQGQPPKDDEAAAEKAKAEYEKAQEYLESDDSKKYKKYKKYRNAYQDTQDDYLALTNEIPAASSKDLRTAKREMDNAFDEWQSMGLKNEVEDAMAKVARYLAYTPEKVFAAAGSTFEKAKDPIEGYSAQCLPSDWATALDNLSWSEVIIKQGSSGSKLHHETKQIDSEFSGKVNYGLWSASASGGYHNRTEKLNKSSQTDKLGMSFKIARVDIMRDWFNASLLSYPNIKLQGFKIGELCSGKLATAATCKFPFIPTSFVIAKDINLYNEFSSEEESFFKESMSWSVDARVGYGPFSLGNKTSSSKELTDEEKKEFGAAVKITVGTGTQIIGFVNTILNPAYPSAQNIAKVAAVNLINNAEAIALSEDFDAKEESSPITLTAIDAANDLFINPIIKKPPELKEE